MQNSKETKTQMPNLSIKKPKDKLDSALSKIPRKFRVRIIKDYLELKRRFSQAKYSSAWDSSGLSAGKFCESVFRAVQNELTGSSIAFGKHIPNFPDECRKLIQLPKAARLETLRIIIPRALVLLYTLRGKRGIGHVGGDVEANEIDAVTVVRLCDWIMCELIRIFHSLSLEEAQTIVDTLAERNIPAIWEVAGKKRILVSGLKYTQKALLLAYSEPEEGVLSEDLFDWVEHSHFSYFKRDVLKKLHKQKLIEYDEESEIVYISPIGIREVEDNILSKQLSD